MLVVLAVSCVREGSPHKSNSESEIFGFGRDATTEDIKRWDIDVNPVGIGLPDGGGNATTGISIYANKCAACHGESGEGTPGVSGALVLPYNPNGPWPPFPRTIGNYWPFATTLFDYINRSMPANAPGSLSTDEVYSLIAWILYMNEITEFDAFIDAKTLPLIEMPAKHRFVPKSNP